MPTTKPYSWCLSLSGCFDGLQKKKSPESEGFINFMNYFINSTFWGSTGKQPQGCKSPVAADEEVRGCCGGDSRIQRLCAPSARGLRFVSHMLKASQQWEARPWKCPANMSLQ